MNAGRGQPSGSDAGRQALCDAGFRVAGHWRLAGADVVTADVTAAYPGLIAFCEGDTVLWISMTQRQIETRLRDVCRGHPSRKTQSRMRSQGLERLRHGRTIDILVLPAGAAARKPLRDQLIGRLHPAWTLRGKG